MTQMPRKAEHMPNIVDNGKDDTCARRHCIQAVDGTRAAQQHVRTISLHRTYASQQPKPCIYDEETKSVSQPAKITQLVITDTLRWKQGPQRLDLRG